MKYLLLVLLAAISLQAESVYNYETGTYYEIEYNNGEIEKYDYESGTYSYEDLDSINSNGFTTYDYDSGEYIDYEY